jgi:hypothetical protein
VVYNTHSNRFRPAAAARRSRPRIAHAGTAVASAIASLRQRAGCNDDADDFNRRPMPSPGIRSVVRDTLSTRFHTVAATL